MVNWIEVDTYAREWIKEAGERIRKTFTQKLDITTKSDKNDLVTNVDKETEQYFIEKIRSTYNDHKILGEEGYGDKPTTIDGIVWIIDPIDGTMNFVHQKRNFMISIGIYENGVGILGYIYDVVHNELFYGKKGEGVFFQGKPVPKLEEVSLEEAVLGLNPTWVTENRRIDYSILTPLVKRAHGTRSYGSAALEIAYVAMGWMDAYITLRLSPWDYAAGKILIEELGGKATTLSGKPLSMLEGSSVFISKPGLHEELLENYLKEFKE
ncbi:inositol monophosphatase family protein [Caldibacillus lycopersici]|uniref:inositol-phosphate phosphatase n=1 Tax=Perspicuibacillus lycopersici TaxID=1325689 RepID=A0AAE3IPX0_9BACI|nr:inositol monophosphatase family protein [Perspicuibacillus lycopersici]MCU9612247.1 inositol monophosphatase family protein [Perspicuibacillus lycopersici]